VSQVDSFLLTEYALINTWVTLSCSVLSEYSGGITLFADFVGPQCKMEKANELGFSDFQYDLAISFAGEDRNEAKYFAVRLDSSGYSVFYDEYETDRLWGSDLPVDLAQVYSEQARFCLIIVSRFYVNKMWPNHERQHALSRLMKKGNNYILPLKLDDSEIPGLPDTVGFLSLETHSLDEVYGILLSKLGAPSVRKITAHGISQRDQLAVQNILQACYRRALYTRMDSEINLEAMYRSLRTVMGVVQAQVAIIDNPALQQLGLHIIQGLDSLERYQGRYRNASISYHIPDVDRRIMDNIKIDIIKNLLELRRRTGIIMQLPINLGNYHFFSPEDADSPPDLNWQITV
jgi:hypothetical protein